MQDPRDVINQLQREDQANPLAGLTPREVIKQRINEEQSRPDLVPQDEARADLARSFVEFIDREADLVKGLAQQSKKDLAREVIRLRAMVKAMRSAASKSGY